MESPRRTSPANAGEERLSPLAAASHFAHLLRAKEVLVTPPTKGMLRDRARGMRKGQSRAENVLWTLLRDRRAHGDKFRRQHPIHPYIADFACVDAKLIVEIDGKSHDDATQAAYDAERTRNLAASGWRVLRFRDDEVLTDAAAVAARIVQVLRAPP
jgi:very-short-patch-repair endonuclease